MSEDNHGNRRDYARVRIPDPNAPVIRKVPAESVSLGESISRNGKTVWVGLDGERVICVAATADEARRKCIEIRRAMNKRGAGIESPP